MEDDYQQAKIEIPMYPMNLPMRFESLKLKLIIILLVLFAQDSYSQRADVWTYFTDDSTELIGYKDTAGRIRIPARYQIFMLTPKFEEIVAVAEETNEEFQVSYLNKRGYSFGKDSVYSSDFIYACESEGFIQYMDRQTGNMGLFNAQGKVMINADYNYISEVNNGMVYAVKGAKKHYLDTVHSGCQHYIWKGGERYLLDTSGQVLIMNFTSTALLNYASVQISKKPSKETFRENFKGVNSQYYSFIDFKKQLYEWLQKEILDNFDLEKMVEVCHPSLPKQSLGLSSRYDLEEYMELNGNKIFSGLSEILNKQCDFIIVEDLGFLLNEEPDLQKYLNHCGQERPYLYPFLTLVITRKENGFISQDQYGFVYTDTGFKLYKIRLENEN